MVKYVYGEVVTFGEEARFMSYWSLIAVSQLISFFFAAIYLVFFLLETQHVRFTNVYVFFAIFWSIGGFLVLMQTASFIYFYWKNTKVVPTKKSNDVDGFMGASFTRDIQLAFYFFILYYLVITASSSSWLSKFGKTIGNSAPTVGVDPEWRVFNNLYNNATCISFIFLAICLRTIIGHFNPLRSITSIVVQGKK